MEEAKLLAPIIFIMGSLMAGAILKVILKRINLPYTVGLFVLGVLLGWLNHSGVWSDVSIAGEALTAVRNIDPDLIINLFLPVLIFSAAYDIDTHIFKRTLTNATILAVPGMVVAMGLTAALMMGISVAFPSFGVWNWSYALMFGALISATDPVAVVALLKELGVSKRFSTLIDGESLLNDGTGIVLFMLFFVPLSSATGGEAQSPLIEFLVVVLGGTAVGYLMAKLYLRYVRMEGVNTDSMVQASVMILLSYITFILAQDVFDLSGVIALVAFGLVIAQMGRAYISERTTSFLKEFWELLSYIANTLIFIIIGVIIAEKVSFTWQDVLILFIVYIGLNLVRMAMVTLFYPILKGNGYGLSRRESLILCWGGLRGALALTLALMVSYTPIIPESIRQQVLFLTAGTVTLTLIINATTVSWLLGVLGLVKLRPSTRMIRAELHSQLEQMSAQYLESLKGDSTMQSAHWDEVEQMLPDTMEQPSQQSSNRDLMANLRLQIISRERQCYLKLYSDGVISHNAQRMLEGSMNHLQDSDGLTPLDNRFEVLGINHIKEGVSRIKRNKYVRWFIWASQRRVVIDRYDVACALRIAQGTTIEYLDTLEQGTLFDDESQLESLRAEVEAIIKTADDYLKTLKEYYPHTLCEAATLKGRRMLLNFQHEAVDKALKMGTIDQDEAELMMAELNTRRADTRIDAWYRLLFKRGDSAKA